MNVRKGLATIVLSLAPLFLSCGQETEPTPIEITTPLEECLYIDEFIYDPDNEDDRTNPNAEYVALGNECGRSIDMTGWIIEDEAGNRFILGEYILASDSIVRIHSGHGENTSADLYLGSLHSIWNNDGDAFYLSDSNGNLILSSHYGN